MGMTQTRAAAIIHRSRSVIIDIEKGKRQPHATYLDALAPALRVPRAWLAGEGGSFRAVPDNNHATDRITAASPNEWIVDIATYRRVMDATSIDEVRALLVGDSVESCTIALPVDGAQVVPWRDAQAAQAEVRAKLRALLEADEGRDDPVRRVE